MSHRRREVAAQILAPGALADTIGLGRQTTRAYLREAGAVYDPATWTWLSPGSHLLRTT